MEDRPFVKIDCPVCLTERFFQFNEHHILCPVCDGDGAIYTRYPEGPVSPGLVKLIRRLITEEVAQACREPLE